MTKKIKLVTDLKNMICCSFCGSIIPDHPFCEKCGYGLAWIKKKGGNLLSIK